MSLASYLPLHKNPGDLRLPFGTPPLTLLPNPFINIFILLPSFPSHSIIFISPKSLFCPHCHPWMSWLKDKDQLFICPPLSFNMLHHSALNSFILFGFSRSSPTLLFCHTLSFLFPFVCFGLLWLLLFFCLPLSFCFSLCFEGFFSSVYAVLIFLRWPGPAITQGKGRELPGGELKTSCLLCHRGLCIASEDMPTKEALTRNQKHQNSFLKTHNGTISCLQTAVLSKS